MSRRKTRRLLLVAAIAALGVAIAVVVVVTRGGEEEPTTASTTSTIAPEETVDHGGEGSPLDVSDLDHGYLWKPVRIGGGGYITGLDIADDGTLVASSDTYGAYIRRAGTHSWQQLLTTEALPEEFLQPKYGSGTQGVAVAASDSSRLYVMYNGYVLVSSDNGVTFSTTAFEPTPWDANGYFDRKMSGKIAVDPRDPDVVLVGTPQEPLRRSTDGGATFEDTAVPAGAPAEEVGLDDEVTSVGVTGIAFDRTSPAAEGATPVAYAASWGNGVYRTADGGATWESIGGPETVSHAQVGPDGAYYAIEGRADPARRVFRYDGSAWTEITPPGTKDGGDTPFLAADPGAEGTVVVGNDTQMFVTRDAGETWSPLHWKDAAGDVTWHDSQGQDDYYLVVAELLFDPTAPGRMWFSTGEGAQHGELPPPGEDTVTWVENSRGIENMVSSEVVSMRNGPPVFGVFDFGQFSGSDDLDDFSLVKGPVDFFSGTTSLDASPFADRYAVGVTTDYVANQSLPVNAAWTDDGGETWHRFESMPRGAESAREFGYGTIAVSTPDNIVWAPGNYDRTETEDFQPYYTLDRGATWQPVVLPGVSEYPRNYIAGYMFGRNRRLVTADEVAEGTFYLYMIDHGVYRTTDGGATWTQVYDGNFSYGDPSFHSRLDAMPGAEGTLFYTDGAAGAHRYLGPTDNNGWAFLRSDDGGATWDVVPGVDRVITFGFGAPAPGSDVATIFVVGTVDEQYGIWRSDDDARSWTQIGEFPLQPDDVATISGDRDEYGVVYLGYTGSSYVYGRPAEGS